MKTKLIIAFLTYFIMIDNCSVIGQSSDSILSKKYYKKASFKNFNSAISDPDNARQIKIKKKITSFPENLSILVNLESIEINISSNFDLKTFFSELSKLNNLKILYIKAKNIEILPDNIGALTNIQYLIIGKTKIDILPEKIGNLKNLKLLGLCCNQIEILPNSIGDLQNLETLIMNNSKVHNLPESFSKLSKLKYIDFHKCNFINFPTQLIFLTKLQEIYLQKNFISEIPKEISNLHNLRLLDLTANQISKLPDELFEMKCLIWVAFYKNPLPKKVIKKTEKMESDNQKYFIKDNCE